MKTIEVFDCIITGLDEKEGLAFFRCKSRLNGDILEAEYSVKKLKNRGIGHEDSFILEAIEVLDFGNNKIIFKYTKVPDKIVSKEERKQIHERIKKALGEDD